MDLTVTRGTSTTASAAFTAAKKLASVTVSDTGGTASFVTESPTSLKSVAAGTPVTVTLTVAVPVGTALGDYTGSVIVSSSRKAVANSLPLTVHVVDPTGHIYWASNGLGTIGRADRDGANADAQFMPTTFAVGVAVNAQYIYWTDGSNLSIGRANLDGTNPNPSFIDFGGEGVAVDANYIYWNDPQNASIGRANLDGSGVQPLFILTGPIYPRGLAVDAQHIYWTDNAQTVYRADLDGSNALAFMLVGGDNLEDVAVNGQYIYWTSEHTNFTSTIGRANLDGTAPNPTFITGNSAMFGIEVDDQFVYWADYANYGQPNNSGTIGRANLDGSSPDHNFIVDAGPGPAYIAVGN